MGEFAQTNERKCKEMKANLLSFVFICFCESGLFSRLRPIQVKKFALYLGLQADGLSRLRAQSSPLFAPFIPRTGDLRPDRRSSSPSPTIIEVVSALHKEMPNRLQTAICVVFALARADVNYGRRLGISPRQSATTDVRLRSRVARGVPLRRQYG
jgi:hypothetical protein